MRGMMLLDAWSSAQPRRSRPTVRRVAIRILVAVVAAAGLSATSAPPAFADVTINGAIEATDPVMDGRFFRNEVISTCQSPKAAPGPVFDSVRYDLYNATATPGACVTVKLTLLSGINMQVVAYSPGFDPSNPTQNYFADPGGSVTELFPVRTFSFLAPPSGSFKLVVHEVNAGQGGAYRLDITGASVGGPNANTPYCAGLKKQLAAATNPVVVQAIKAYMAAAGC